MAYLLTMAALASTIEISQPGFVSTIGKPGVKEQEKIDKALTKEADDKKTKTKEAEGSWTPPPTQKKTKDKDDTATMTEPVTVTASVTATFTRTPGN
jgi:hypothetical protein